jgi:hypothetical protein
MIMQIKTKNGIQYINEGFDAYVISNSAPLFLAVEAYFYQWLEGTNPANEYDEMYFGEDAIYTVRGAIIGGIELVIDYMRENNLTSITTKSFRDIEIECAFE